jgi:F-type H+-transporting ATPase subunit b
MLIDWFTVGAQVLNFVILVWLLKRFLYRPVLDAIDAREARIVHQIDEARATQATALREQQDFQGRNQDFDARRDALLKQAAADADVERLRLADAARRAADAATARRQDAERHDVARLRRGLADRTREEVFAISRRVLGDLGDATLDERIAAVFLRRLAALDQAASATLASGLDANAPRATVRSAFEPNAAQRETLRAAVVATLEARRGAAAGKPIDVSFETAPDLLGGVEVVVGGRKLGWNVEQYLDSLQLVLDQAIPPTAPDASTRPAVAAVPLPEAAP